MIKLLDLLTESKYDTTARKITSEVIKLLKQLKKDADDNPKTFKQNYKEYGNSSEISTIINYPLAGTSLQTLILIEIISSTGYAKGTPGSPRNRKSITKGYDVTGEANTTSTKIEIHLTVSYSTFQNLNSKLSKIYYDVLGVARHELEHILQTSLKISDRESNNDREVSKDATKRKQIIQYRELPTELEADVRAINLLKKKKRIPFKLAAQQYYSEIPQINRNDIPKLIKTVVNYSKKLLK
jgi:hypothetical protein